MLSRFIPKPSLFYRVLTLTRSPTHLVNSKPIFRNPTLSSPNHYFFPRNPQFFFFSTKGENGNGSDDSATSTTDLWKFSPEVDEDVDSVFSEGAGERKGSPVKIDYSETLPPSLHLTMLSRFIPKPSLFYRVLTLTRSPTHLVNSKPIFRNPTLSSPNHYFFPRNPQFFFFSTKGENGNGSDDSATSTTDLWKFSPEVDEDVDSVFSEGAGERKGSPVKIDYSEIGDPFGGSESGFGRDIFSGLEGSGGGGGGDDEEVSPEEDDEEVSPEEFKPWNLTEEGKEGAEEDMFGGEATGKEIDLGYGLGQVFEKSEQDIQLEKEEKALSDVLKGPNRAFGDLIASSGITDEMLDSLIALKDFEGIQGLPPLSVIEEKRYEKNAKRSGRSDMDRQKLEEAAKARVRKVDEKGRAYGTGRRKCSIARVYIQPGGGKFFVNDKEFDVYFPMLDHRATLLRPFSETKTLGMWDVNCTVKGGGTSGQVGAILLGISRALQSWEPGFRPPLKQAGFLTRDPRVVERKKPGKAKARKSFQWVKR